MYITVSIYPTPYLSVIVFYKFTIKQETLTPMHLQTSSMMLPLGAALVYMPLPAMNTTVGTRQKRLLKLTFAATPWPKLEWHKQSASNALGQYWKNYAALLKTVLAILTPELSLFLHFCFLNVPYTARIYFEFAFFVTKTFTYSFIQVEVTRKCFSLNFFLKENVTNHYKTYIGLKGTVINLVCHVK